LTRSERFAALRATIAARWEPTFDRCENVPQRLVTREMETMRQFETKTVTDAMKTLVDAVLDSRVDGRKIRRQLATGSRTLRISYSQRDAFIAIGIADRYGRAETLEAIYCDANPDAGHTASDLFWNSAKKPAPVPANDAEPMTKTFATA
jgi:hypothetical protein